MSDQEFAVPQTRDYGELAHDDPDGRFRLRTREAKDWGPWLYWTHDGTWSTKVGEARVYESRRLAVLARKACVHRSRLRVKRKRIELERVEQ